MALATQGLAKRYGSRVALDGLDLRVPDGRRLRVPGSQRGRQDDDDADPHRAHPARCGQVELLGPAVRAGRPAAPVRGRGAHRVAVVLPVPVGPREPARARRDRCADARRPGRRAARAREPARAGRRQGVRLLAGDEAAAGHRRRAPVRSAAAAARRAGERPRPGRASSGCATRCGPSPRPARRCSSRATSCPRSSSWPTSSGSSPAAGWCARARSRTCCARPARSASASRPTRWPAAATALAPLAAGAAVSPAPDRSRLARRCASIPPGGGGQPGACRSRDLRLAARDRDDARGPVPRAHGHRTRTWAMRLRPGPTRRPHRRRPGGGHEAARREPAQAASAAGDVGDARAAARPARADLRRADRGGPDLGGARGGPRRAGCS